MERCHFPTIARRHGIVMRETAAAEISPAVTTRFTLRCERWKKADGFVAECLWLEWVRRNSRCPPRWTSFAVSASIRPFPKLCIWRRPTQRTPTAIYCRGHASATKPPDAGGEQAPMLARAAGAGVILVDGTLAAYLRRRNPSVAIFLRSRNRNVPTTHKNSRRNWRSWLFAGRRAVVVC